jgi:hypothetical protein
MATNVENVALANNIALVKNYVDDPNNLYGVLRKGLLTGDLETPFVNFVGASTMSYPVFPLDNTDLPNYSKTNGYERLDATLERKELTVSQDKGYQMAIDAVDLEDSHTTAVAYINNTVRQKEIPNIDKYRLNKLATASGVASGAVTDDPLADYDKAAASLVDNELPLEGTILYTTTAFYNAIKASDRIKRTAQATDGNLQSTVTSIDGVTKVVVVPATRMPAGKAFILVQPLAVIAGIKRNKSSVKDDPEDFDGILINRRLVHDCFVLEDRVKGIYVGTSA